MVEPSEALAIQPASTDVPSLDLDALAAVAQASKGRAWQGMCGSQLDAAESEASYFELSSGACFSEGVEGVREKRYPRQVNASQLLEEWQDTDEEVTFCGPHAELHDSEAVPSELFLIQAWELGPYEEDYHRRRRERKAEALRRGLCSILGILPEGEIQGEHNKYICEFILGLEDDDEFCLVKRILGKGGCNMRSIAEECNAKVRLRGRGSGFLEGSSGLEANMPLKLSVSCTSFTDYAEATQRVSNLLRQLYKHYRRYCRSKCMEPADVQWLLAEVRRDDLRADQMLEAASKAKEKSREVQSSFKSCDFSHLPHETGAGDFPDEEEEDQSTRFLDLPGPIGSVPFPSTAEGRRAAARRGGALAGALVSAAAREVESMERQRGRQRKQQQIQEEWERANLKPRQSVPRGEGVLTRLSGDAQSMTLHGPPIGAFAAKLPPAGLTKGKGEGKDIAKVKLQGKGKDEVPSKGKGSNVKDRGNGKQKGTFDDKWKSKGIRGDQGNGPNKSKPNAKSGSKGKSDVANKGKGKAVISRPPKPATAWDVLASETSSESLEEDELITAPEKTLPPSTGSVPSLEPEDSPSEGYEGRAKDKGDCKQKGRGRGVAQRTSTGSTEHQRNGKNQGRSKVERKYQKKGKDNAADDDKGKVDLDQRLQPSATVQQPRKELETGTEAFSESLQEAELTACQMKLLQPSDGALPLKLVTASCLDRAKLASKADGQEQPSPSSTTATDRRWITSPSTTSCLSASNSASPGTELQGSPNEAIFVGWAPAHRQRQNPAQTSDTNQVSEMPPPSPTAISMDKGTELRQSQLDLVEDSLVSAAIHMPNGRSMRLLRRSAGQGQTTCK